MTTSVAVPLGNYAAGSRAFGPAAIPDGATQLKFAVARCTGADLTIWPNSTTSLVITFEISVDGGAHWAALGGFSAIGGRLLDAGVDDEPESSATYSLPSGANRQLRGTLTISGGTLRSSASLVCLP